MISVNATIPKKSPIIFLKSLVVVVLKMPKKRRNPDFVAFSENIKFTYLQPNVYKCCVLVKVRQSQKQIMVSSILPKNKNHYPEYFLKRRY